MGGSNHRLVQSRQALVGEGVRNRIRRRQARGYGRALYQNLATARIGVALDRRPSPIGAAMPTGCWPMRGPPSGG